MSLEYISLEILILQRTTRIGCEVDLCWIPILLSSIFHKLGNTFKVVILKKSYSPPSHMQEVSKSMMQYLRSQNAFGVHALCTFEICPFGGQASRSDYGIPDLPAYDENIQCCGCMRVWLISWVAQLKTPSSKYVKQHVFISKTRVLRGHQETNSHPLPPPPRLVGMGREGKPSCWDSDRKTRKEGKW